MHGTIITAELLRDCSTWFNHNTPILRVFQKKNPPFKDTVDIHLIDRTRISLRRQTPSQKFLVRFARTVCTAKRTKLVPVRLI